MLHPHGVAFSQANIPDGPWQLLRNCLPILLEQGLVRRTSETPATYLIPFEAVGELANQPELGLSHLFPPVAPWTLEIRGVGGALGAPHFAFELRWFDGDTPMVPSSRVGCFVRRGRAGATGGWLRLDAALWQALETIAAWEKTVQEGSIGNENALLGQLQVLGRLQALAVQAPPASALVLDAYLSAEPVVVPKRVSLGFLRHEDGRVSAYPVCPDVPELAFQREFLRFGQVQSVYTVALAPDEAKNGAARLRVVLSPTMQAALQKIRPLSRLDAPALDGSVLRPGHMTQDLPDPEVLSFEGFSTRVQGLGMYAFSPRPYLRYFSASEPGLLGARPVSESEDTALDSRCAEGEPGASALEEPLPPSPVEAGLVVEAADGTPRLLAFDDDAQQAQLRRRVKLALQQGQWAATVDLPEGTSCRIPVSTELLSQLDAQQALWQTAKSSAAGPRLPGSTAHVLVYQNDTQLAYVEPLGDLPQEAAMARPEALKKEIELKPYQEAGVAWLQAQFRSQRRGVLLADDMGLGKTLQVMTFLAWVLETGWQHRPPIPMEGTLWPVCPFPNTSSFEPVLIITPVSLLDNWMSEFEKFFSDGGQCFQPWLRLHGATLDALRRQAKAQNPSPAEDPYAPPLPLDVLRQYRVILTNYDTLKQYELAFARMRWTLVVADEAQAIKNDDTGISQVLRALDTHFRIAMTGTPVENRLLDLWSLMDFVQPGLLGTRRAFWETYEQLPIQGPDDPAPDPAAMAALQQQRGERLRALLHHGQGPAAFILNRQKSDHLPDLPPITEHRPSYQLTEEQEAALAHLYKALRAPAMSSSEAGGETAEKTSPLAVIHHLRRLHEHPVLYTQEDWAGHPAQTLLARSNKLRWLIETLTPLAEGNTDKCLVFTPLMGSQALLKSVLDDIFGLNIAIINGQVGGAAAKSAQGPAGPLAEAACISERTRLLHQFRDAEGFQILILSPLAAGTGLNIVSANHVVHYGRWWNPAIEHQATCRVYRLGQTKPVSVHFPIGISRQVTPSFEQALDTLLGRKEAIRQQLLCPSASPSGLHIGLDEWTAALSSSETSRKEG
jgi:hypothetical protein